MSKNHEKLLVAALAGIIIVGAGAFAVQPVLAGKTTRPSTELASLSKPIDMRLTTQS
jgi:hypothetical protein